MNTEYNIIPTGDWMFVSEEDNKYANGVLYDTDT